MKRSKFLRGLSTGLALTLLYAALPFGALAAEAEFIQLVGTDVTLDETHYEYTGEEIRPNVTVRVQGTLLTLDTDYTLEFKNNIEVGEAAVVVTGIETAGYTGTVEHPFFIDPSTSEEGEEEEALITIQGTDVTIDGTEFPFTGEAIEPAVTVTVQDKTLTAGEDYTLIYENNVEPGTASVTVTGVADKGYTGSVTIQFTILAAAEAPTEPEETEPGETEPVSYKITEGDGATWHKASEKDLTFTADGAFRDFEKLLIDGKTVNTKYYTVKEGRNTVVTLKDTFLQHLDLGKHTVTLKFTDGEAEGTFKVSAPADDSNPKTGDSFALHGWTALLFVSLTGIIGTAFACRKKLRK